MSNRAMRRQIARSNRQTVAQMSKDARKAALVRNGITPEDVQREYDKGRDEGFSAGVTATGKLTYAAIGIALHDLHGFGHKRILRVLQEVDKHVQLDFSSLDAAEELLEKTGIRLNWGDPIERVQEV